MHLHSQRTQRGAEFCRESFTAVDFLLFCIPIVFSNNLTIFILETAEAALQALLVISLLLNAVGRQLNDRFFVERASPISPFKRFCVDQFRHTIDVAIEVIDVFPFVNPSRDAIYRFVGIDIRHIRAAPLKILQQLKADVLIFLAGLIPIAVEHGEKAVERGLSENPFAFG